MDAAEEEQWVADVNFTIDHLTRLEERHRLEYHTAGPNKVHCLSCCRWIVASCGICPSHHGFAYSTISYYADVRTLFMQNAHIQQHLVNFNRRSGGRPAAPEARWLARGVGIHWWLLHKDTRAWQPSPFRRNGVPAGSLKIHGHASRGQSSP